MKTKVSLIIAPDPISEPAVFCEVAFEGAHLHSLTDEGIGRAVRESMLRAEQFIETKRAQINAARN